MGKWIATWAQAHSNMKPMSGNRKDRTIRTSIVCKMDGSAIRIRLSNKEGKKPAQLLKMVIHLGKPTPVMFSGKECVTIGVGESIWSDPILSDVAKGTKLTISFAYRGQAHSGNQDQAPTQISIRGNYVSEVEIPQDKRTRTEIKYDMAPVLPLLSGVEILTEEEPEVLVCFGDSITQQGRWTKPLEQMLRDSGRNVILINKGIGGNQLLSDPLFKIMTMWGPAAITRFHHDVMEEQGVTGVIFALGTNDIGMARSPKVLETRNADKLYATLADLTKQVRQRGCKAYVATLTPRGECGGYHQWQEDERLKLNEMIRSSCEFDAVFDFDAVTRDNSNPFMFDPLCDSGDHLHPGIEGGRRMAEHACEVLTNQNA